MSLLDTFYCYNLYSAATRNTYELNHISIYLPSHILIYNITLNYSYRHSYTYTLLYNIKFTLVMPHFTHLFNANCNIGNISIPFLYYFHLSLIHVIQYSISIYPFPCIGVIININSFKLVNDNKYFICYAKVDLMIKMYIGLSFCVILICNLNYYCLYTIGHFTLVHNYVKRR